MLAYDATMTAPEGGVMPVSKKPNRPFPGNKYMLGSKEFQELQRQNIETARQIRSLQALVISLIRSLEAFAECNHPPQGEVSVPGDMQIGLFNMPDDHTSDNS